MSSPKALRCQTCRRQNAGRIECRGCGRRLCKHFARSITDGNGKLYDPLRDPWPKKLLGTCVSCLR